jgi:hypothetical protein
VLTADELLVLVTPAKIVLSGAFDVDSAAAARGRRSVFALAVLVGVLLLLVDEHGDADHAAAVAGDRGRGRSPGSVRGPPTPVVLWGKGFCLRGTGRSDGDGFGPAVAGHALRLGGVLVLMRAPARAVSWGAINYGRRSWSDGGPGHGEAPSAAPVLRCAAAGSATSTSSARRAWR